MADKSQNTEKPTPKKLRKAREEGRFPTSREFVAGVQFLAIVMIASAWGSQWFEGLHRTIGALIVEAFRADVDAGTLVRLYEMALARVAFPLMVAGGAILGVTLALQLGVTGFGATLSRLTPKFEKLNPATKLKQLPRQNATAVVQCTLTLAFCSLALYHLARQHAQELLLLPLTPLDDGIQQVFAIVGNLLWKAALVFVVFGAIDFVRQRRRFDREMRMSKQEIREEFKQVEGNPAVKARIRRLQNSARRRTMMRQVPGATAVVVNPTHYAVALRYNLDSMSVPVVVAKGKNYLALRIRHLAEYHDVPLIENPPLAQALYKAVPVGGEIPPDLYRAVAEILAYVYRVMNKKQ